MVAEAAFLSTWCTSESAIAAVDNPRQVPQKDADHNQLPGDVITPPTHPLMPLPHLLHKPHLKQLVSLVKHQEPGLAEVNAAGRCGSPTLTWIVSSKVESREKFKELLAYGSGATFMC
jgi:hypothetical protein